MKSSSRFPARLTFVFVVPVVLIVLLSALGQRRFSQPGVYEGEDLVNKATINGGSVAGQEMSGFGTGWSGNAQLFWAGGAPGAVLDLMLDVPAEGIYEIELHMTRAPDFGRLRIQVENKNAPERFDGYAPTVVPSGAFSLGTYDLQAGPRKISFMIDGKNERSTNFFAGIDYISLKKMQVAAAKTQSGLGTSAQWKITAFSISPEPTTPGFGGEKAYKENQPITVQCSYEPIVPGAARLQIWEYMPVFPGGGDQMWIKQDVAVTKAGSKTTSFVVGSNGIHYVRCGVFDADTTKWTSSTPEYNQPLDMQSIKFQVVAGIVPTETKWPTAPIIETPIQNGKITVKAFDPSGGNCTDGGTFWFEWKRAEEISPGHWGNWQLLKVMWKPLGCVAEGSTKDISGMNPGYYAVRAQLRNGKYNFISDWSDWNYFEIPKK